MFPFDTPENEGFPMFSGGVKRNTGEKKVQVFVNFQSK